MKFDYHKPRGGAGEGAAPGGYVLKLTITDRSAKKSVTRQIDFTVE